MQQSWMGSRAGLRVLVALALTVVGVVLITALPAGAAPAPSADTCGYSDATFNENTVMRGAELIGSGSSTELAAFANDENALLLGVNGATANTSSPQHVSSASGGDPTAVDASGRPLYPALFITNVTSSASSTAGDFQNGGKPRNLSGGKPFVDDVFGTWATGTLSGGKYQRDQLQQHNDWNLGPGADTPTDTSFNEGYGAEVRWNVGELTDSTGAALTPGNTYRIQVIEHDGDQNKNGGDAGEYCVTLKVPGSPPKPTISTTASSNTTGQPIHDTATISGSNGASGTVSWTVYSGTGCSGNGTNGGSAQITGDGSVNSPDYTPSSPGNYQWVATYTYSGGSVATSCSDANEVSTVSNSPSPAITVVKLERDGSSGPYVAGPITVKVGDTIDYQITVTNSGNTPLALAFSDPVCASTLSPPSVISGTYDSSSHTLSVGGALQYTCSHVLTSGDPSPFVNTATATGTSPSGQKVNGQSSVVANKQSLLGHRIKKHCPAGKVKKTKRNKKGKKVVVCVARKLSHGPKTLSGFTG